MEKGVLTSIVARKSPLAYYSPSFDRTHLALNLIARLQRRSRSEAFVVTVSGLAFSSIYFEGGSHLNIHEHSDAYSI